MTGNEKRRAENAAYHAALAAASAAEDAARAAVAARNLLYRNPDSWDFADAAYWLCRAGAKAAEDAAIDGIDPDAIETNKLLEEAHFRAMDAARVANEAADDLVTLAEAADHEIRR